MLHSLQQVYSERDLRLTQVDELRVTARSRGLLMAQTVEYTLSNLGHAFADAFKEI